MNQTCQADAADECQYPETGPAHTVIPAERAWNLFDFGNGYLVRYGIYLSLADGVVQHPVAVLYAYIFNIQGVVDVFGKLVLTYVYAVVSGIAYIDCIGMRLMYGGRGLPCACAPGEGARYGDGRCKEPVLVGAVACTISVVDAELNRLFALTAIAQVPDDALVIGNGLIYGSGKEALPYDDDFPQAAANPRVVNVYLPSGSAALGGKDCQRGLVVAVPDAPEPVFAGWQHSFGILYGIGQQVSVNEQTAFGVEVVACLTINSYFHIISVFFHFPGR